MANHDWHLHDGPLNVADFLASPPAEHEGGEVLFAGTVRNHHNNQSVSAIRYHAHRLLAEKQLHDIETKGSQQFDVYLRVAHAVGLLKIGEASVVVLARSAHRAEAFAAARWAIDTVKETVAIWKEEHYADGSVSFQDGAPIKSL